MRRSIVAALAVAVGLVLALVVGLADGPVSAAPEATRTGYVVSATIGAEGGVLMLTDTITTPLIVVEVPPLAVTAPVTLVLEQTFPPDHPPTRPWIAYSFISFYLDAYRGGRLLTGFTFSRPVTVTTHVYDYYEDMAWRLFYWDDGVGRWEEAVETCDPRSTARREVSYLHTPVCRASVEFAMLTAPFNVYLPIILR